MSTKATEWMWRASPSLGPDAQVFSGLTGSFSGNYGPPSGFCWDVKCDSEPMQDDPSLDGYNVNSRVADFVERARWQANASQGSHVLFTMGSDYQYECAEEWFVNLDKLIKHVNAKSAATGVTTSYSNMDEYVAAKLTDRSVAKWPLKTDDFFPYADGPHMFWSGFFTSRPALKRYVRTSSALLQAARQLVAVARTVPADSTLALEEALGVVQHHDAITGTEMQHVAFDYARRLHAGAAAVDAAISKSLNAILATSTQPFIHTHTTDSTSASQPPSSGATWQRCELLNVSVCTLTQQSTSTSTSESSASTRIAVYNPLAQPTSVLVSLPVQSKKVKLTRLSDGSEVSMQTITSGA